MPTSLVCISASNIAHQPSQDSTSFKICQIAIREASKILSDVQGAIIELKNKSIQPCAGCGACFDSRRCAQGDDFNSIYAEIIRADILLIVSPHYAPIPAKLSALLEKMEQITFLHWGRDPSYTSEVSGKPTGVISHGGGGQWALKSYKSMVNDTIANALDTIQLRLIPFDEEWNTGLSLPVKKAVFNDNDIFPFQEYNWDCIGGAISAYVKRIAETVPGAAAL